jgi:hypothetical protein
MEDDEDDADEYDEEENEDYEEIDEDYVMECEYGFYYDDERKFCKPMKIVFGNIQDHLQLKMVPGFDRVVSDYSNSNGYGEYAGEHPDLAFTYQITSVSNEYIDL